MATQPAQFFSPPRKDDSWFFAGHTSSFPNLTESGTDILCEPRPSTNGGSVPGCKVFHIPSGDISQAYEVDRESVISHNGATLQDQVLIFQYKGNIFATDNRCPHSSYPLAAGTPFDIEDFGVVLSAGITCPKHGWSFDLYTGRADRSNYKLRTWEVQLRPARDLKTGIGSDEGQGDNGDSQEVWVRRKQRIG
ncbi:hypothetical protein F5Y14DRAFT_139541 [Nemania sp. NC0429]|nr:hypothetical protein F5Y14DRAFT_139541 [Nemania sp. NC0429]